MNNSTINKTEIEKFTRLADEWWDPFGKFRPLHKFNPVRIKYIKDFIVNTNSIKLNKKPLKNLEILDIGCGGGLLSEPMCKLGANVTGIDASNKNIAIAKLHAKKSNLKINYLCCSPENFRCKKKFDVVLNMEIVEHVKDINFFLNKSSAFLNKKGLMFIATLNKTLQSYIFAIIGAEYILKWLPIGTHDWEKFVKPEELITICGKNNLNFIKSNGVKFNPLKNSWSLNKDLSINYISVFKKN